MRTAKNLTLPIMQQSSVESKPGRPPQLSCPHMRSPAHSASLSQLGVKDKSYFSMSQKRFITICSLNLLQRPIQWMSSYNIGNPQKNMQDQGIPKSKTDDNPSKYHAKKCFCWNSKDHTGKQMSGKCCHRIASGGGVRQILQTP